MKLEIGFQDPYSPDSILPQGSTVAIKEPYLRYCGEGDYAIHVDHPSDIAILRGDDSAVSIIMDVVAKGMEVLPAEWRELGDKAYLEKNYSSAVEWYENQNPISLRNLRKFGVPLAKWCNAI